MAQVKASRQAPSSWKKHLRKLWHFLWYDDSWLSWLANLVLAFILIKFVIYPLLGLMLGSQYPIVAVVSNSMKHTSSFDDWWQQNEAKYSTFNISKEQFEGYRFHNGFNKGDIMVLVGVKPEAIRQGDVLVFRSKKPDPIIHRVVVIHENTGTYLFQTKGDNNQDSIQTSLLDETSITEDMVLGVAVVRIPYFGWLKIGFYNIATCPFSPSPGACFKDGFRA